MSTEKKVDVLGILEEVPHKINFRWTFHKQVSNDLDACRQVVAELIEAAREVEADASSLGMSTTRLTAALARVGGAP
ncbi:MAG: hypothetical protein GAK28_02424 [Luteibacter sp.]|uniref:hypothetical protein n=1 Tax=Luteibacter sp. TaxID=1886636 RepID=UPI0013845C45|nr:hypothetical protein [Luteibacter sp.]KAF1006748.1 MAG: hypothetical protein GAK28_02424 [Luteibacter sp.]